MKTEFDTAVRKVLLVVFFVSVIMHFFHPVKIGDIWWHLNTGKWIWENGELPVEDPFTYTTTPENYKRTALVLKGYWLSQLIYYATFNFFGFQGLALFNALLYALLFYLLWKILLYQGLDHYTGLLMIAPCIFMASRYDEVRPVNFTYFNILFLYYLMEEGLARIKKYDTLVIFPLVLLALLGVLWANLHRGFVIIYAVLAAYAVGEFLTHCFRARIQRPGLVITLILLPALMTLLNPNFINPIALNLKEMAQLWGEYGNIVEQGKPWELKASFRYTWAFVAILTSVIMVISWRRLQFSHIILFLGVAIGGAIALKLTFFFILMSVAISGRYTSGLAKEFSRKSRTIMIVLVVLFAVVIVTRAYNNNFKSQIFYYNKYLPEKAVDFMMENKLPQPIFNPYNWGGYLSWRLYPEYKVFTDSRMIDPAVHAKFNAIYTGMSSVVLDEYGINTAIFNPVDFFDGDIEKPVLYLIRDADWRLVYFDNGAVIFVREGSMPNLPSIDNSQLALYLVSVAMNIVNRNPFDAEAYFRLAAVYYAIGQEEWAREAEKAARKAISARE